MVKWSCNGCGFIEVTLTSTITVGLKCRGCNRDINIFNATFVPESNCFNFFAVNAPARAVLGELPPFVKKGTFASLDFGLG